MTPTRRAVALGAVTASALAAAGPAGAIGAGGGFSVSGKKGPFVKQVASRKLDQATQGGGSLALASDAVNSGQYQAARLRMPETEARVAALLDGIDSRWPYPKGQPLQVHILGVDYFNAYSLPDGSIMVAFGLLDQAQSDDEVAFVLAHELGHVRLGHFNRAAGAQQKRQMASQLGQLFVVGAALHSGGAVSAIAQGTAAQAGATNDFLHFLVNVTTEPTHSRGQEDEADCIGYDLSLAASYSADSASARVFDTIQADQVKRASMTDALDAQLKSQLGQVLTEGTAQSFLSGGLSPGGMRNSLIRGAGMFALGVASAGMSDQGPQHRPPEERKKGISQYSIDAYPDGAPLREEQHAWLTQVRASKEYAQGKIAVEAIAEAKKARAAGDYPTATKAVARAMQTNFRDAPLVLNEAARLHDDMGDASGSDRLFLQAHASPDQTVDGYLDHVRMLYRTRQNDRAMQIIQDGTQRFDNDEKPFLSLMIAIARQSGRPDEAQRYLQQCLSYNDDGLTKDCQLAAGPEASKATPKKSPSLPFGLPRFP